MSAIKKIKKTTKKKKAIDFTRELSPIDGSPNKNFKKLEKDTELISNICDSNIEVVREHNKQIDNTDIILNEVNKNMELALRENYKILTSNTKARYKLGAIKVAIYTFLERNKINFEEDEKNLEKDKRLLIENKLREIFTNVRDIQKDKED